MDSEAQQKTGLIYRINLPENKIYIGRTTYPIKKRLYSHASGATSKKKKLYKDVELPFVAPYKNYKGKNSSILRLISNNKKASELYNLPQREIRRWLTDELLKRTEILEEVELIDGCSKLDSRPLTTREDTNHSLASLEQKYITAAWVENPRQLLNYDALPFHAKMRMEVFKAFNESIEKLGNCRYEHESGRYCLSWDYEWGQLTDHQEAMLEQARSSIYKERLRWYNSLSPEERAWEDECEYSDTFGFSDEMVAQEVVNKLLPIDREVVKNKRSSLFNKKKDVVAKELKRLSELSKEERRKLIGNTTTI
jgi:predicted GIY-YIG superfamily endonuclease